MRTSAPLPVAPPRPQVPAAASPFEKAGFAVLLTHLLLCPLVFTRDTVDCFEFPKVSLLCLTALVLALLGISSALWRVGSAQPRKGFALSGPSIAALLYLASAMASTLFSISPRTSLRGVHENFAGLGTVAAYVVLFFAGRWLVRTPADARRLLAAAVVGGAAAAVYGAVQALHLDPLAWDNVSAIRKVNRPFGTLGHANHLAAYLVMVLPASVFFFVRAIGARCRTGQVVLPAVCLLLIAVVGVSLSRGAWLALLAVAVFVLLALRGRFGGNRLGLAGLTLLIVAALVGLGLWMMPAGKGVVPRVAERLRQAAAGDARLPLWGAGVAIFLDHPLCGCGLDTFPYAFAAHRPVALARLEWEATPTRAHNEILHTLATQGLFGGVALLVAIVGLCGSARSALRRTGAADRGLALAVSAGLLAFCVQALFSFTVAGCGSLLVTLAAILSAGWIAHPSAAPGPIAPPSSGRSLGRTLLPGALLALAHFLTLFLSGEPRSGVSPVPALAAVVGLGTLTLMAVAFVDAVDNVGGVVVPARRRLSVPRTAVTGWRLVLQGSLLAGFVVAAVAGIFRPYRASRACAEGDRLLGTDRAAALHAYEQAIALDCERALYWTRSADAALLLAEESDLAAERVAHLQQARQALERAAAMEPADANHRANLGRALGRPGETDFATAERALREFDAALALDPVNPRFLIDAGRTALALARPERVRQYARRALALYPSIGQPRALLSLVHWAEGHPRRALRAAAEADAAEWWSAGEAHLLFAEMRVRMGLQCGHVEEARRAAEQMMRRDPDRLAPHLILADVSERAGDREGARREYRRALELCPAYELPRAALARLESQAHEPRSSPSPQNTGELP